MAECEELIQIMKRIMRDIARKRNLEENLPKFGTELVSLYYRFAYVHLSMNYYGYYEIMAENKNESQKEVREMLGELNDIIHRVMLPGICGEELVQAVKQVDAIRESIIHAMQILTAYTDVFNVYEHVLNRVEYRFRHGHFPEDYSDEMFCRSVMQYIVSDQDNMVVNTKITQIIRQLPVRMTKNRFFELVKNGISIYENNAKEGLEDFLYMLRTGATLDQPAGMEHYEDLYEIYTHLKEADYSTIDGEQYERLSQQLLYASSFLQDTVDVYVMLTDLVNDVYSILLATPYAIAEVEEIQACKNIIEAVCGNFRSPELDPLGDVVMDQLIFLEGRQEQLHEQYMELEYGLDQILAEDRELLQSLALDSLYYALQRIMLLQSGSQFVALDKKTAEEAELASAEYTAAKSREFIDDLTCLFEKNHKMVNRAVMAATLSELPVFFQNLQELQDYIYDALHNCRDEAEKKACIELLASMMEEE